MVGVNQVIMLSLNMVIIASMIGAGGLGYDVLLGAARGSNRRGAWRRASPSSRSPSHSTG
jgi:ABC-type proline/glycine betaine transport system permease subunit